MFGILILMGKLLPDVITFSFELGGELFYVANFIKHILLIVLSKRRITSLHRGFKTADQTLKFTAKS